MNIYDIAKKADVSIATVSRVINHKGNVNEKTRAHVLQVIEEMGYTPNVFARGLGLNSMKMVGVICSTVDDMFYARAVATIENELRRRGYDALLCCTGDDVDDKRKGVELLISKRVDAMILVGSVFKEQHDNSHIEKAAAQVPVITVNGYYDIPNTYCVLCNEMQAMYDNVALLAERGRRDILYLYDSATFSGISKLNGYKNAVLDLGLNAAPELIVRVPRSFSSCYEAVLNLLNGGLPVDAVVASEDIIAAAAVKALAAHGRRIPQDTAVIGFNNSVLAQCCTPALTTVDNKVESMCISAVNTLIDVFEEKNPPRKTLISAELILRETV